MPADGKWHLAADSPVGSALPWPTRNASAGVPPVCLWRAAGKADGTSRHHCRGQGRGQVCMGWFWLWVLFSLEEPALKLLCLVFFYSTNRYGKLEELLEKSFPLVKMPSIQPVVMQVLKHLPKASVSRAVTFLLKIKNSNILLGYVQYWYLITSVGVRFLYCSTLTSTVPDSTVHLENNTPFKLRDGMEWKLIKWVV